MRHAFKAVIRAAPQSILAEAANLPDGGTVLLLLSKENLEDGLEMMEALVLASAETDAGVGALWAAAEALDAPWLGRGAMGAQRAIDQVDAQVKGKN